MQIVTGRSELPPIDPRGIGRLRMLICRERRGTTIVSALRRRLNRLNRRIARETSRGELARLLRERRYVAHALRYPKLLRRRSKPCRRDREREKYLRTHYADGRPRKVRLEHFPNGRPPGKKSQTLGVSQSSPRQP
jgi:hypothetical protein